jgi:hypothetical protein
MYVFSAILAQNTEFLPCFNASMIVSLPPCKENVPARRMRGKMNPSFSQDALRFYEQLPAMRVISTKKFYKEAFILSTLKGRGNYSFPVKFK